jgi:uncharacterized membrane protein
MSGTLGELALAGLCFLAIHFGISGSPLRAAIVGRIGEKPFAGFFALLSLIGLIWLIWAYAEAPARTLWQVPALAWLPVVVMPLALILALAAYATPKPGGRQLAEGADPAPGIFKVSRHPFLMGAALWAASHMIAGGDDASLIFFGVFLVLGIFGPASIDAKARRRNPERFQQLAAATSIVPLAAIVAGRSRVSLGQIGWWRIALALVLYAALFWGHGWIAGGPITLP